MENEINVKLESDFHDYYDHWFDREGIRFERYSTNWIGKKEQFRYLNDLGLEIPSYHQVGCFFDTVYNTTDKLVVYKNEYAHTGKGKKLLEPSETLLEYWGKLASEYIEDNRYNIEKPTYKSISARLLQIGDLRIWLFYGSKDDWRSNCGNCDIEVILDHCFGYTRVQESIFAIDFVPKHDKLYAVDFNTSPGLKNTGVEDIISGKGVVNKIKQFYQEYDPTNVVKPILPDQDEIKIVKEILKRK